MQEEREKKAAWWRRGWILIVGAVLGVALILWGNRDVDAVRSEKATTVNEGEQDELVAYGAQLERKIEALCEGVCGVSGVRAVVTFSGDFQYTYATDSDTQQKDGIREDRLEYVTVGSGSSEQTVLLSRTPPDVSGIGIVCDGGASPEARRELVALLSATFGIGSNKIYVAEANVSS